MRGPRAADVLLHAGLAKEEDLARAARAGGSLVYQLVRGGAPEAEVVAALGRALRLPTVNLRGKRVDPEVLALVPRDVAERYGCLPLFVKQEGGSRVLFLGVEDPTDEALADDVSFRVGLRVRPVVVGALQLRAMLRAGAPAAPPVEPPEPDAPPARAALVPATDTDPIVDGAAGAEAAVGSVSDATPALPVGKPRDVPTRDILRAVTRLLIDKDVFTRAELLEAVSALRAEGDERV
jgi:type IV pilus assembly protein PilB